MHIGAMKIIVFIMGDNGQKIPTKLIAQLFLTAEGQLLVQSKVKSPITLAKYMAQGLHFVVKQIPEGEPNQVIIPNINIAIDKKPQ